MTARPLPLSPPPSDLAPTEPRWSRRRSLAFMVVASVVLWAGIIAVLRVLF